MKKYVATVFIMFVCYFVSFLGANVILLFKKQMFCELFLLNYFCRVSVLYIWYARSMQKSTVWRQIGKKTICLHRKKSLSLAGNEKTDN